MTAIRHQRSSIIGALGAIATLIATLALTLTLMPSPASAVTPAQRCQRGTNAWKAIGQKPPAPYRCGGTNQAPPPLSPSTPDAETDKTTAPTKDAPAAEDRGSVPA